MPQGGRADGTVFKVVVNHEERYSIWPAERETPAEGWRDAGKRGTKAECQRFIDKMSTEKRTKGRQQRGG